MNNYSLTIQEGLYHVHRDAVMVGNIQPGALLNHYGLIIVIEGVAISYSVICLESTSNPADMVRELVAKFRERKVGFTVIAEGLFTAQVINASAFLLCGGVGIAGLWLHEISGTEFYIKDTPNASYWVEILNSKLAVGVNLKIIQQDALNLRYVFARLLPKSIKS